MRILVDRRTQYVTLGSNEGEVMQKYDPGGVANWQAGPVQCHKSSSQKCLRRSWACH